MRVVICPKEDDISWEELANLLHEAFEERLQQGLHFSCSYLTAKELERRSSNSIVLIAEDTENRILAGTVTIQVQTGHNHLWAYHFNLAVKPSFKHHGIGSQLFKSLEDIAITHNCDYIQSDTAIGAKSSVKWHKKNGFIPIGLRSFPSTNYYSIVFRKQLTEHWFWSNEKLCRIHYRISYMLCHLYRYSDGSFTCIGKMIYELRRKCF